MYTSHGLLALAATLSTALAAQGFNYGSTMTDGTPKTEQDFINEFNAAKKLPGTNGGFTSARIYTMTQAGPDGGVISAIPAAIKTGTHLLLGLWASGGDKAFQTELDSLTTAIQKFPKLSDLVDGISVGSEDLYRISPLDKKKEVGTGPDTIARYIKKVKTALGDAKFSAPVGHVDTWTAWVNSSNSAVVDASDFIGTDAYPYFQSTMPNHISKGKALFDSALAQTKSFAKGKDVWITETGWPVSGPDSRDAKPSVANAKKFWQEVGCGELFGKTNVWWFTLQDASPETPSPSFGLVGSNLNSKPLFDLSCKDVSSDSSSASASASATESGASASHTASGHGHGHGHGGSGSDSDSSASESGSGHPSGASPTGGAGGSSNSTATSSPSAGAGGAGPAPSASSTNIPTAGAASRTVNLLGALGAVAAVVFLL